MASGISGAGRLQDGIDYSVPHRPPPAPPSNASASPSRSPDFAHHHFPHHQRQKSSGSGSIVKGRSRKNSLGGLLRGNSSRALHSPPPHATSYADPLTAPPLPPPPTLAQPPTFLHTDPNKHFHYGEAATVTSTAYPTPPSEQPSRQSTDDEPGRSSTSIFRSRSKCRERKPNMLRRSSKAKQQQQQQQQAELERQQREAQMLPKQPPRLPSHNPLPGMPSFGGEDARPDSVAMFNQQSHAARLVPQSGHVQAHAPVQTTANFSRPGNVAIVAAQRDNSSSPSYVLRGASASASPPPANVATANGDEPHERTGSMTNRGRYSYAPTSAQTGHVNSPRRMRRRKDPTPFNVLVVGTKNSGKSSFISLLNHSLATSSSKHETEAPAPQTKGNFTSSYLETEMDGERVGLTLWDSAGLEKNIVDLQLREMTGFIESKFEETFAEEQKVMRSPGFRDTHIHCVFLVLDPLKLDANIAALSQSRNGALAAQKNGLDDDVEVQVLRALWEKTVVVPVIAKADTLTVSHLTHLKRAVWQSIIDNSLNPLDALELEDDDEDDEYDDPNVLREEDEAELDLDLPTQNFDEKQPLTPIDNLLPSSSSESSPVSQTAKSKRLSKRASHARQPSLSTSPAQDEEPYLPMSIISPDPYTLPSSGPATEQQLSRIFPWGSASPLNPAHCDFPRLRDSVFSEWRTDLRELSRARWYEQWRTSRLRNVPGTKMRVKGGVTPVGSVPREGRGEVRNFSGPGVSRSVSAAQGSVVNGNAAPVGMAVGGVATAF